MTHLLEFKIKNNSIDLEAINFSMLREDSLFHNTSKLPIPIVNIALCLQEYTSGNYCALLLALIGE